MEKRQLTKEEIDSLDKQYADLKATLDEYREVMQKRGYKKAYDQSTREQAEKQFTFFKSALNETLITLMSQDGLKVITAIDALGCRYVKLSVKWRVSRYLRHERKQRKEA